MVLSSDKFTCNDCSTKTPFKSTVFTVHCSMLHIKVAANIEQHSNEHTVSNKKILTVVGSFNSCCMSPLHSVLSCVLLSTIKSAEGCLVELLALCLLDSPWTSPLLQFDPLLPRRLTWFVSSGWGILVIAVLLLFSPLALPSFDLTLLAFAFVDLPLFGWLSDDFSCCCRVLLDWGGVIGGCGWMVGGLIMVGSEVMLVCTVLLPMTTSVRSSVWSLAKLTKTYKMNHIMSFRTNLY